MINSGAFAVHTILPCRGGEAFYPYWESLPWGRPAPPQPTHQVSGDGPSARNTPCWGTHQLLVLSGCKGPKLYTLQLLERLLEKNKTKKKNPNPQTWTPLTARKYFFLPPFCPIILRSVLSVSLRHACLSVPSELAHLHALPLCHHLLNTTYWSHITFPLKQIPRKGQEENTPYPYTHRNSKF